MGRQTDLPTDGMHAAKIEIVELRYNGPARNRNLPTMKAILSP